MPASIEILKDIERPWVICNPRNEFGIDPCAAYVCAHLLANRKESISLYTIGLRNCGAIVQYTVDTLTHMDHPYDIVKKNATYLRIRFHDDTTRELDLAAYPTLQRMRGIPSRNTVVIVAASKHAEMAEQVYLCPALLRRVSLFRLICTHPNYITIGMHAKPKGVVPLLLQGFV